MVPATDDALRVAVRAAIGVDDVWPVRAEPYSQWVVERDWATALPPLAEVGVQVVDDVAPWERVKLRILNALHTAAAHYGLNHGRDTVDTVMSDPGGAGLLLRVAAEIVEVLEAPAGVDVDSYVDTTLDRFANSGLGHRCAQIATDTSQKLPQRVLDTVRLRLERGLPIDALADVLALWAWSTLGRDHLGRARQVDDPLAATYAEVAAVAGADARALVTALVGLEPVFGDLADSAALVATVTPRLARLLG
jgi:fructuronate reductase